MQKLLDNTQKKKLYFNQPQRMALHILAAIEYHVWGRRAGKTHGLTGLRSLQNVLSMPKSMGAFLFPTYRMGLAQILPNIISVWEFFGYREGIHFFIGKKPPSKWKWEKPYFNPKTYDYVISWYNGSAIMLISQDRAGTSNSVGFDWVIADEAKFLDYEKIKTETIPAISGVLQTIRLYQKNPRFKSQLYCTDMPILKKSQWILSKKKDVDWDLIGLIKYYRKNQAGSSNKKIINHYQKILDELRAKATFYSEASVLDNIKVVGEKYVKDMNNTLPRFEYKTAILNIPPNKIENGFYHAYNPNIHNLQVNFNNDLLDKFDYDLKKINENNDCRFDNDIEIGKHFCIAEDHNADINSLVIGQPKYDINELWFNKAMYVKMPLKFSDLINKFVKYYKSINKEHKKIVYYYDSTSIRRSELTNKTNADIVREILIGAGWDVNMCYLGNPEFHDLKYDKWNYSFSGNEGLLPKFNKYNCYDLLVAMQQTGIKYNHLKSGWGKDKSNEHKYFETEETQPHLTDAMDTLKRGCEEMPIYEFYNLNCSNIYG